MVVMLVYTRLEFLLALERTIDTVVWQLLASVACPGYTIHTVVEISHAVLKPIEVCPRCDNFVFFKPRACF